MKHCRVAVVHLGRPEARGEVRRVEGWVRLLAAAGAEPVTVPLLERGRPAPSVRDIVGGAWAVVEGRATLEALAWSARQASVAIGASGCSAAVLVTARAFHPAVAARVHTVLDLVDALSDSYRARGAAETRLARRVALRALAIPHRRLERRPPQRVVTVAAGHGDARRLGAMWIPNPVSPAERCGHAGAADRDILFVGTMTYPPNREAVRLLAEVWPALRRRRPGITAILAGAQPDAWICETAHACGWDLIPDFDDLRAVLARARLSIAPLRHATGIQNKVLDASAHGLATVCTPAVMDGLGPGFPAAVAVTPEAFVDKVLVLLENKESRLALGEAARRHVTQHFSEQSLVDSVRGALRAAAGAPDRAAGSPDDESQLGACGMAADDRLA